MNELVVDEFHFQEESEEQSTILEKKQSKNDIVKEICQINLELDTLREKRKDRHAQNTEGKNSLLRLKDDIRCYYTRIISLLNSIQEIHGKETVQKLLSVLLGQSTYAQDMINLGNLISKKKNEIDVCKDKLMVILQEERKKKRHAEEIRRYEMSNKKIQARIQRLMAKSRAKK